MSYRVKMAVRTLIIALVVAAGVALITLTLHGCVPVTAGPPAGHTTTFPALPACLVFCFAEVTSTVDSRTVAVPIRPGKKPPASGASAASAPASAARPASAPRAASAPPPASSLSPQP